ncbi:unnamed protein product [Dibothriocephalus latus]|uniref:Ig-like domain-containing protein n=1 Tax=Dibothriocephalus latus TaxID=60516 RepID=A0A3P7QEP5_DIBLA|nr:unnamed protein product [Dibothriocephalus latus]
MAQNISINCTARPSELVPMIVWKYSDESTGDLKELSSLTERTDGRIYQEENGTLVISQVEESDPRKFLCFLTPKESSTATPISVAVNLEVHGRSIQIKVKKTGDGRPGPSQLDTRKKCCCIWEESDIEVGIGVESSPLAAKQHIARYYKPNTLEAIGRLPASGY